jgi:glutaredoxin
MKTVIFILLAVAAVYFIRPAWFNFNAEPGTFRGDGSERIVLFTTKECGNPCRDALAYLNKSGQTFEEIKLDGNDENIRYFHQLGGANTVPYLSSGYQRVAGYHPADYLSVLVAARGDAVLNKTMRDVYAQHYDKNGQPILVMYGTSWCVDCAAMREYCNDHNIKYQNWDAELDAAAKHRYALLEGRSFPLVFYGSRRMTGFSESALNRLLKK